MGLTVQRSKQLKIRYSGTAVKSPLNGHTIPPDSIQNSSFKVCTMTRVKARIFQGGGGGVTLCQSEGTHVIVMSFLPPVVGCLLNKSLQKGGSRPP